MSIIESGKMLSFLFVLLIFAISWYLPRTEWKPTIRHIPALDALEEAIGRAVETDAFVHFSTGRYNLTTVYAPQILASLSAMRHVAYLSAKKGAKFKANIPQADVLPQAVSLVKEAYHEANVPEEFNDGMIEYFPDRVSTVGIMSWISRNKVAANILLGPYRGGQITALEVGAAQGAIQIGGTARIVQIPPFALACEYFIIGEELYAVGAILSQEHEQIITLAAEDVFKVIAILLILFGTFFLISGSESIVKMLGW